MEQWTQRPNDGVGLAVADPRGCVLVNPTGKFGLTSDE